MYGKLTNRKCIHDSMVAKKLNVTVTFTESRHTSKIVVNFPVPRQLKDFEESVKIKTVTLKENTLVVKKVHPQRLLRIEETWRRVFSFC